MHSGAVFFSFWTLSGIGERENIFFFYLHLSNLACFTCNTVKIKLSLGELSTSKDCALVGNSVGQATRSTCAYFFGLKKMSCACTELVSHNFYCSVFLWELSRSPLTPGICILPYVHGYILYIYQCTVFRWKLSRSPLTPAIFLPYVHGYMYP